MATFLKNWRKNSFLSLFVAICIVGRPRHIKLLHSHAKLSPYFNKFMARFPSIDELAAASQDEVLLYWAGLGYYARARNLHKAAQIIQSENQSQFPNSLDEAIKLPGLGRSTASAILAIVDNQPLAILDGNVKRVLTRLYAIDTPIQESKTIKQLWEIAESLTPADRTADYTQAIMDLGATHCTRKKPNCKKCSLLYICEGNKTGQPDQFPVTKKSLTRKTQHVDCLLMLHEEKVLLTKRPNKGIWGGLYTLPLPDDSDSFLEVFDIKSQHSLEQRKHVFTHIDLFYTPIVCVLDSATTPNDHQWFTHDELQELALPKPIQQLVEELKSGELKHPTLSKTI